MNLRMAKAYRTTSSEALCTMTGITPIIISSEVAVKQYIRKTRGSQTPEIDKLLNSKIGTPGLRSQNC